VTANIRAVHVLFAAAAPWCRSQNLIIAITTGLDLTKIFFFLFFIRSALVSVKLRWAPLEEEVCFKFQTLFCVCFHKVMLSRTVCKEQKGMKAKKRSCARGLSLGGGDAQPI
jgi:hypothetical protein